MANIIIKNYEHYNRSLPNWHCSKGRYISSKSQYERECRDAGLVPYESIDAPEQKRPGHSKDTVEFLEHMQRKADKKGNVSLSDNEIRFMVGKGAIKSQEQKDAYAKFLPKHYQDIGGFGAA